MAYSYCAIAIRTYPVGYTFRNLKLAPPQSISEQADFWKKIFFMKIGYFLPILSYIYKNQDLPTHYHFLSLGIKHSAVARVGSQPKAMPNFDDS
ncbi:hypothetical protein PY364_15255 [Kamptonema sp. UHCC 0994]|nr:hypothetical protein [Kamptonema sp. UHCC 0994]